MKSLFSDIRNFFVFAIIGITSMLPGISGATMAVVFGVYERLIRDVAMLREYLKKDFVFILVAAVGIVAGTLVCAKILDHALENYPVECLMFFLGLIIGQLPMLWMSVKNDLAESKMEKLDPRCLLMFAIGAAITVSMIVLDAMGQVGEANVEHNAAGFVIMIVVGMIVAVSALLPGLSHSTILLVLGLMSTFTAVLSELDAYLLLPLALGTVVAVLLFSKIIHRALEDHHLLTMQFILGLTVGSVAVIGWYVVKSFTVTDFLIGLGLFAAGLILSIVSIRAEREYSE